MRHLLVCLVALMLFGCATPGDIAEQSTKGNLGIEDANNKMLLLNALRASKHRPMYFSSISSFTGPLGNASPQFTLGVPFSPGGQNTTSTQITPNVANFTLSVFDGQKFTQGITTPVKPEFVQYLVDQGWPRQFLLSLMIREIIYETKKGEQLRVVNYPGSKSQYYQFQDELLAMLDCGLSVEAPDSASTVGPELSADQVSHLRDLVSASKEKLAVTPVRDKKTKKKTGKWVLTKASSQVGVKFAKLDDDMCKRWTNQRARFIGALPIASLEELSAEQRAQRGIPGWSMKECVAWEAVHGKGVQRASEMQLMKPQATKPDTKPQAAGAMRGLSSEEMASEGDEEPEISISLFVRSPEAMLYYLGELIRAQLRSEDSYDAVTLVNRSRCAAIFRVSTAAVANSFVNVKYEDETYWVASGPADRSSHALTLTQLLVDLQKEASDIPQTTLIRVIPR